MIYVLGTLYTKLALQEDRLLHLGKLVPQVVSGSRVVGKNTKYCRPITLRTKHILEVQFASCMFLVRFVT